MKHLVYIFLLVFLTFYIIACKEKSEPASETFDLIDCESVDDVLKNAQKMILDASDYCLNTSRNTDSIDCVFKIIKTADNKQNTNKLLYNYWLAFCKANTAICLIDFKMDSKADSTITETLELLNKLDKKNSEIYSLLAMVQGMSINYRSAMTLTVAAEKCKIYSEKAIELNPNNMRSYLVLAIYDFYTPEVYQGGKIVENSLKQALEKNTRINEQISCLPSWGKDLVYRYLIRFYFQKKENDKAYKYLDLALNEFPENKYFQKLKIKKSN